MHHTPSLRKKLLTSTFLLAPAMFILAQANPAMAVCSGGDAGGITVPTNGSTVTCEGISTLDAAIGDGTTTASVILAANSDVSSVVGTTDARNDAINLDTLTLLTIGAGSTLAGGENAIETVNDATITAGANTTITGVIDVITSTSGAILLTAGQGTEITSSTSGGFDAATGVTIDGAANNVTINSQATAVEANGGDVNITLGDNATIAASASRAISANQNVIASFGANAEIDATSTAINALNGDITLTLGDGSTVDSSGSVTINADNEVTILGGADDVAIRGPSATILAAGDDANITLGDNAIITSGSSAVSANQNVIATFGANADINAFLNAFSATNGDITLTLGNGSNIDSSDAGAISSGNAVSILGGADNVVITAAAVSISASSNDINIALGDGAIISSLGAPAINANQNVIASFGANTDIDGVGSAVNATNGDITLTLGDGSTVDSSASVTINANNEVTILGGADDVAIRGSFFAIFAANDDVNIALGDRAIVTSTAAQAILAEENVVATFGANADIDGELEAIRASDGDITLTVGDGSTIDSATDDAISADGAVTILGGADNVAIRGNLDAIQGNTSDVNITLGDNAIISSTTESAINASQNIIATFGDGAVLTATAGDAITAATVTLNATNITINGGDSAIIGARDITLGAGSDVSSNDAAINGTTGDDTVDNAGIINSNDNSLELAAGDDVLTLRTGSNLTGNADGGDDTDTVNLFGTGSEDVNFVDFENLNMGGDDWTLSGASTFTTTAITNGTLSNNGTLTSAVNITGGIFGGTGTTVGTVTNTSGTLAPGNSIGTQTITGDYIQDADGALEIEIGTSTADLLDVSGSATIAGELIFENEGTEPLVNGASFFFIQTGAGLTGDFDTVTNNLFLANPILSRDANNFAVQIELLAPETVSENGSENTVLTAIDDAGDTDPTGILPTQNAFGALNGGAQSDALSSLTGIAASTGINAGFSALNGGNNAAKGRLGDVTMANYQVASFGDLNVMPDAGTFWLSGIGGLGETDSSSDNRATEYDYYGTAFGAEKVISNGMKIGLFGGVSIADGEVDNLSDDVDVNIYQLGGYAGFDVGRWDISSVASAAYLDFETSRPLSTGAANADFSGTAFSTNVEAVGEDIVKHGVEFAPVIGMNFAVLNHEDYSENGGGAFNLDVDSQTTTKFSTFFGGRISKTWTHNDYKIIPTLQLGWEHEFLDEGPEFDANFSGVTASSFTTDGPEIGRDAAAISLDVNVLSTKDNKFTLYSGYDGRISSNANDHAFTVGVRVNW